MRLAIISDVHANLEALRAVLSDISECSATRIVCLGDVVGYNADPAGCIALLREAGALCVGGNHDRACVGLIAADGFGAHAVRVLAWTWARLGPDDLAFLAGLPLQAVVLGEPGQPGGVPGELVAVHGALTAEGGCERTYLDSDERRLQCFAALAAHPSRARICAFGHTHRLGVFELGDGDVRASARGGDTVSLRRHARYLLNPGSVGQPRSAELRATYLILDTVAHSVAVRRVPYDSGAAMAKVRAAGLAPRAQPIRAGAGRALAWGARAAGLAGVARRIRSGRHAAAERRNSPRA
jgi:diadenosine tetraphosphatase ApaH/serine/threonine PP2A family protein phosphatase